MIVTLKDMKPGQKAKVLKINHGGNLSRRLFQIGLIPGAELTVISQHPFKGPVVFELGNATFALGQGVAGAVEVYTNENK
jgi:ferrous iron transport protein A